MSTLTYRIVELERPEVWKSFEQLELTTFPSLSPNFLRHIMIDSGPQTFAIGCYDGGRLAGVNAFIGHQASCNGQTGIAFQSCLTATHSEYRGRGIFQGLINSAKEELKAKSDSAFLFGYPNNQSSPIFCTKLGFKSRPMIGIDASTHLLAALPRQAFDIGALSDNMTDLSERVFFDMRGCAKWKEASPNGVNREFEDRTNFLFGRSERRKVGPMSLRVFRVGGMAINKPTILNRLITKAGSGHHLIRFVQPADASLAVSRRWVRSTSNTEPLIDFPLNWPSNELKLEAWTGLKDVY